jgi:heme/copper-type cytochrome/quinol oxidase subunit 2
MRIYLEWVLRGLLAIVLLLFLVVVANTTNFKETVDYNLIGKWAVRFEKWETLFWPFVFGAAAGLMAGWMWGARQARQLATELRAEREHNRKLEAANRALEASVPVLHEVLNEEAA